MINLVFASATALSSLGAQDGPDDAVTVARRVLDGGVFFEQRWRRDDDGMLEYFVDTGDPEQSRFAPLLGDQLIHGLANAGVIGLLSLACHGDGDLLGMTDAEFHLGNLGVDTTDVGLRQYLALPSPSFAGPKGRADLLDRMLAIDLLRRRGCRSAVELRVLAGREGAPPALRERARVAAAALSGADAAPARRRLDAGKLLLPASWDGCVIVDHSRLPDLSWLGRSGRRLMLRYLARQVLSDGGTPMPLSYCQGLADIPCELPFGVAHRYGNARLDQSCTVVTARRSGRLPVAIRFAAAGSFEADGWRRNGLADKATLAGKFPFLGGMLDVESDSVRASTDDVRGEARPELAEELLRDTGAAMRILIPQDSQLWGALAFLELPAARRTELRIWFGEVGRLMLSVAAPDADGAAAWVERGRTLLAQSQTAVGRDWKERLEANPELRHLLDAAFSAKFEQEGDEATATVEITGFGRRELAALIEKLHP